MIGILTGDRQDRLTLGIPNQHPLLLCVDVSRGHSQHRPGIEIGEGGGELRPTLGGALDLRNVRYAWGQAMHRTWYVYTVPRAALRLCEWTSASPESLGVLFLTDTRPRHHRHDRVFLLLFGLR